MSQTTTALLSYGTDSPSKLEQVAIGELKSDEALVEIQASGICHTDLSCMDGTLPSRFPCVFGHEGALLRTPHYLIIPFLSLFTLQDSDRALIAMLLLVLTTY